MNRGLFNFLNSNTTYQNIDKKWIITLDKCHKFWYDLIVYPNQLSEKIDTNLLIRNKLKEIEKSVQNHLDKRFVYFICSRTKVRFNTHKKIWFNPINQYTYIPIIIGKKNTKKYIKVKFIDCTNTKKRPKISLQDKFINIYYHNGNIETFPIHEFLDICKYNLGISNKVEYVGYTNEPSRRPTNGSHSGLRDILYKVSNEDNDFLIYFNTFIVRARTEGNIHGLNILSANAMTDEIDVDTEGKIIEKCFISYFNSENQNRNRKNEDAYLKNNLELLISKYKIHSIDIFYDQTEESDYTLFSSSTITAKHDHYFSISLIDSEIVVTHDIPPIL